MNHSDDVPSMIRVALRELNPGGTWQAHDSPRLEDIYAPEGHRLALDPDRALVVGNRGVGKSFWSGVLSHAEPRDYVGQRFPRLRLDETTVVLGFHEGAAATDGVAPSARVLVDLLSRQIKPDVIWQAVLLRGLGDCSGAPRHDRLGETIDWISDNLDAFERGLRRADTYFSERRGRFVLLFDALDRLASEWESIRRLSKGILQLALELRSFRALRAKIFLRSDQANDPDLFGFPDASKLRAEAVDLVWRRADLYGLSFKTLWNHHSGGPAFRQLARRVGALSTEDKELPTGLMEDERLQETLFDLVAGKYMGSDARRGRTYSWVHGHLADAFGQTSPRSFLIALQEAASQAAAAATPIDHHGIRRGVQRASQVRLEQLEEDYFWIETALSPLAGLSVPCDRPDFLNRWREKGTVEEIQTAAKSRQELGPVELLGSTTNAESNLLDALLHIGVIEERSDGRINMPDIFRDAASIKRKGGVRPPTRK